MKTTCPDWPADPVFAGLFPALAPQALLAAVRDACGDAAADRWANCLILEALYDPGQQLRMTFALGPDGLSAERAWPDGDVFYIRHPVRAPMSRRGCVIDLAGTVCELFHFPNDRRLRGLRHFAKRREAAEVWQGWIAEADPTRRLEFDSLRRSLLRYVPEQKCIIRLLGRTVDQAGESAKASVAVRAIDPDACGVLFERFDGLRRAVSGVEGAFRMPKPLALDPRLGLMAVRWVWGDGLLDILGDHDADEVLEGVARGLRTFHRADPGALHSASPATQLAHARLAVKDISSAAPHLESGLAALLDDMHRRLPDVPDAAWATVHNDFHWKQLRGRPGRLTLLDFERCVRGDALVDVATFAAQLELLSVRDGFDIEACTARRWSASFLSAWERVSAVPLDVERMNWHAACALLTLARGQLRHLRPGWPVLAEHCVERAARLVAKKSTELCR